MLPLILLGAVLVSSPLAQGAGYPSDASAGGYPDAGSGYPAGGYPAGGGSGGGYAGGYGGYGNYPQYQGYYAPPAPPVQHKQPLTAVDKLFARVADLDAEMHIYSELVDSVLSRFAVAKRAVDKATASLIPVVLGATTQNSLVSELADEIKTVNSTLNSAVSFQATTEALQMATTGNLVTEGARLAMAIATNTGEAADIAGLTAALPALRERLLHLLNSKFQDFDLLFDQAQTDAKVLLATSDSRRCETGKVTMHRDDRRAEAIFTNNFGVDTPQIIYGISGYDFDLKAGKQSHAVGYGGYGGYGGSYGHSLEPNAIGVFVTANPTPDSVTFQTINLGFGQTDLLSVTISYEACSFGSAPAQIGPL